MSRPAIAVAVATTIVVATILLPLIKRDLCGRDGELRELCAVLGVDRSGMLMLEEELRGVPAGAALRGPRAPLSRQTALPDQPQQPKFSEPRLFASFVHFFRSVASLSMLPYEYPSYKYYPENRGRSVTRRPIDRWLEEMRNDSYPPRGHGRCLDWGTKYMSTFPQHREV